MFKKLRHMSKTCLNSDQLTMKTVTTPTTTILNSILMWPI